MGVLDVATFVLVRVAWIDYKEIVDLGAEFVVEDAAKGLRRNHRQVVVLDTGLGGKNVVFWAVSNKATGRGWNLAVKGLRDRLTFDVKRLFDLIMLYLNTGWGSRRRRRV